jgi:DNA-binding transcriptional ArsR family regulator
MENLHLCFETLANQLRTEILKELETGPKNVSELTKTTGAERTRISHALTMLRKCKFITVEKRGKQRIYTINSDSVLHNAIKENKGIFHVIQEHKQNNCISCHKTGLSIEVE